MEFVSQTTTVNATLLDDYSTVSSSSGHYSMESDPERIGSLPIDSDNESIVSSPAHQSTSSYRPIPIWPSEIDIVQLISSLIPLGHSEGEEVFKTTPKDGESETIFFYNAATGYLGLMKDDEVFNMTPQLTEQNGGHAELRRLFSDDETEPWVDVTLDSKLFSEEDGPTSPIDYYCYSTYCSSPESPIDENDESMRSNSTSDAYEADDEESFISEGSILDGYLADDEEVYSSESSSFSADDTEGLTSPIPSPNGPVTVRSASSLCPMWPSEVNIVQLIASLIPMGSFDSDTDRVKGFVEPYEGEIPQVMYFHYEVAEEFIVVRNNEYFNMSPQFRAATRELENDKKTIIFPKSEDDD